MSKYRVVAVIALLIITLTTTFGGAAAQQADGITFPQTGQTVRGRFLQYWQQHGGLPQQGFPISGEFDEVSDLNGKTYRVQYFERAAFELHPENRAPYDVLLSQLGTYQYQQKYGRDGASGQRANPVRTLAFPATGKVVGGRFREYWEQNGGLAQQGYPISNEFQERSDLDGKTYTVQYFERAVFEFHPENAAPYDVLLSQLGKFRYDAKYRQPAPQPTSTPAPPTPQPSGTPTSGTPTLIASNVAEGPVHGAIGLLWVGNDGRIYSGGSNGARVLVDRPASRNRLSAAVFSPLAAWAEPIGETDYIHLLYINNSRPPGGMSDSVVLTNTDRNIPALALGSGNELYYAAYGPQRSGVYVYNPVLNRETAVVEFDARVQVNKLAAFSANLLWAETDTRNPGSPATLRLYTPYNPTALRTVATGNITDYALTDRYVAWTQRAGSQGLYLYDIQSGRTTTVSSGLVNLPSFGSSQLIWTEGPGVNGWDIKAYDLQSGQTRLLTTVQQAIPQAFLDNPNTLIYRVGSNLYSLALNRQPTPPPSPTPQPQPILLTDTPGGVQTAGGQLFWIDSSGAAGQSVERYDPTSGQTSTIYNTQQPLELRQADDKFIVWIESGYGKYRATSYYVPEQRVDQTRDLTEQEYRTMLFAYGTFYAVDSSGIYRWFGNERQAISQITNVSRMFAGGGWLVVEERVGGGSVLHLLSTDGRVDQRIGSIPPQQQIAVGSGYVAWTTGSDDLARLYIYDIASNRTRDTRSGRINNMVFSGSTMFLNQRSSEGSGSGSAVVAYDPASGTSRTLFETGYIERLLPITPTRLAYLIDEKLYLREVSPRTATKIVSNLRVGGTVIGNQAFWVQYDPASTKEILYSSVLGSGVTTTLAANNYVQTVWQGDNRYLLLVRYSGTGLVLDSYDTQNGDLRSFGDFTEDVRFSGWSNGALYYILNNRAYRWRLNDRDPQQISNLAVDGLAATGNSLILGEQRFENNQRVKYLHLVQLDSQQSDTIIGQARGDFAAADLSDRYVVWTTEDTGRMGRYTIYLYDRTTKTTRQIASDDNANSLQLYGDRLLWHSNGQANGQPQYVVKVYDVARNQLVDTLKGDNFFYSLRFVTASRIVYTTSNGTQTLFTHDLPLPTSASSSAPLLRERGFCCACAYRNAV